ncbi:tetratricopeptide repeat protein [Aurantiacibacter hainanensis]|uniref:tetratricopeptide repeat protein n=1 Tax=Aurantiacibacter hainanensis TaxID=3076114 RepID=UPI0030C752CA
MNRTRGISLIVLAVATAGCQSFPIFGARSPEVRSTPDMSSYFEQRLADGRRHLEAQRPGAALTAFRQASYHPDHAGEAFNGMAIAYDRLGRYDLAERFFAQAVSAAPGDARFARNAARFGDAMLARNSAAEQALLARNEPVEVAAPTDTQLASAARAVDAQLAPMPQGRMQRVSASQVHIAPREDWGARLADAGSARPAVMHVGRAPDAGPELAGNTEGYVQRVDLAAVRVVEGEIVDGRWTPSEGSRFIGPDGAVRIRVSGSGTHRPQDRQPYPIAVRLDNPG